MRQKIIDLTLKIENNMLTPSDFQRPVYVKVMTHEDSLKMGNGIPEDPITSSYNYLSIIEHVGTHVDAFYHMRPDGLTIDEMPLSMFFGKAVCLDMRHIPERGKVTVHDVEAAEKEAGVSIDGHIVLFATGLHERYYPDPRVITQNVEITPEVVRWLYERGSKVHGVEGPSTDIMDTKLYPSHRACRDLGITHYEWLVNLTSLIGAGEFTFYGVPLLLSKGTGSPVRAFAIINCPE